MPILTRPKKQTKRIETPPCGYDWTGPGVAALTQKIKKTTGRTIDFRFNQGTLYGSNHGEVESKIFIAPTAVLQQHENYPIYGVYAKQNFSPRLKYPYCLGEYQGKITKSSNESSNEKQEEKILYTFDLGHGTELNAEHEGSWPRMINSASSEHTANVFYQRVGRKTYCFLKHPLQAGEQLLGYYGDDYPYEDEHKRFLHPSDNWQSSRERYQTYKSLYNKITHEGIQYAVPNISQLTHATINLPILKYHIDGEFLPQHQQENKTLIHWACETGDTDLLDAIQTLNPDLTIQSRISGHTALHCVILNHKLSTTNKINFLNKILSTPSPKNTIATLLQDKEDQSILHLAIAQKNIQLIRFCLQKTTQKQWKLKKDNEDMRHGLNKQGWDFILAAIATGSLEVLETIRPFMTLGDITNILEDHADVLRDIWSDLITKYDGNKLRSIKDFLSRFCDKTNDIETNDITHQLLNNSLILPESDNWPSSTELYQTHQSLYHHIMRKGVRYALPDITKLTHATINLPVLTCADDGELLPQHLQANKTLLHWVCETGDVDELDAVKSLNPDITIQSRTRGHTALHCVMLNHRLSTQDKIDFMNNILSDLPQKSTLATLFQDKDDQTILHLAIAQKNIKLISYCLQIATKKQLRMSDEDIRTRLNKQGWNFILAAIATGSTKVLETIQPYMTVDDLYDIVADHTDVLRDVWSKLTTAYNSEKLRDIKDFLSGFFEKKDDIIYQLLKNSLVLSEPECSSKYLIMVMGDDRRIAKNLATHFRWHMPPKIWMICTQDFPERQVVLSAKSSKKDINFVCSHDISISYIKAVVKVLQPGAIVFDNAEQNLWQRQAVAESLAKHACFALSNEQSLKATLMIVSALNPDTKLMPNPLMPRENTRVMAQAIRPGVIVQCHRALSERQLHIIAENLKPGVGLWCSSALTTAQMQLLASILQPGAVFYCASTMTEGQITTVVPLLKPGVRCTCDTNVPPQKIALIMQSLPQGVRFYCHDNLSLDNIEYITDTLRPNQIVAFDPDLPVYKLKKSLSRLKAGVTIDYHAKFLNNHPIHSWINDCAEGVQLLIDSSINVLFFDHYQKKLTLDISHLNGLDVFIEEKPGTCRKLYPMNAKKKRKADDISQPMDNTRPEEDRASAKSLRSTL